MTFHQGFHAVNYVQMAQMSKHVRPHSFLIDFTQNTCKTYRRYIVIYSLLSDLLFIDTTLIHIF